jgi:DNA-binding GntR family transcriptional regulator
MRSPTRPSSTPTRAAADALQLPPGERVFTLRRLQVHDAQPVALEHLVLVAGPGARLATIARERPFHAMLRAAYGSARISIQERISPVTLGPQAAQLLGRKRGRPAFRIEQLGVVGDAPVAWCCRLLPGDHYLRAVNRVDTPTHPAAQGRLHGVVQP